MKLTAMLFIPFFLFLNTVGCAKFDPYKPLTAEETQALLVKAKQSSRPAEPYRILSSEEIAAVLERVKATPVEPVDPREAAILETNYGVIVIAFYPQEAPGHCSNFKRLIKAGYFDQTRFHRIIDGFVIQGGDILTRDEDPMNDGSGGPGYTINAEFNGIPHDLGIVSMARAQDPNSAGSQFFICLSRERTRFLDGKYTVFGRVIGGLDVVQKIGRVPVKESPFGEPSSPIEPVVLKQAFWIKR
ncbi:MAG: peptidylprolyl isomerase [candidate division KSB1 bacterium]|nr:peptidylprolyl isomerase [candidate division KSB1 bacterium]